MCACMQCIELHTSDVSAVDTVQSWASLLQSTTKQKLETGFQHTYVKSVILWLRDQQFLLKRSDQCQAYWSRPISQGLGKQKEACQAF